MWITQKKGEDYTTFSKKKGRIILQKGEENTTKEYKKGSSLFYTPKNVDNCIMTKLKTAQKPKLDIQPNDITEAKYEFSALQKNIIYEVIGELQHLMTKDMLEIGDLSIEDLNISVSVSKLAGSNNHRKVIDQAKELMRKIFEYDYNKDDKKHLKVTTLFHAIDHQYYSDTVKLQISPGAVPVLLYIGNGFTQVPKDDRDNT